MPRALAAVILVAAVVGAWMFRFETFNVILHRNRVTGAICHISQECWFKSWQD